MRVLVAYASRYGATRGIAERIAEVLRQQDQEVVVQPVREASDPSGYEAFVIGSAAYYFHWMMDARKFVRRHRDLLASRPVWLFSSGPLGTKTEDDQGRDLRTVLEPREIEEFRNTISPVEHRVFFGAMDPGGLNFTHRLLFKLPANRDNALFPIGDFRDWSDIEAWARTIGVELRGAANWPAAVHPDADAPGKPDPSLHR